MSVTHIGLILDHFDTTNSSLKLVAIILADHADSDGLCWPSYKKIAQRANMHERSVARHIKELIDLGIISKLRTGSLVKKDGEIIRISNAYRVNAHIIVNRKKLSTKPLCIDDTDVYLGHDTGVASRSTRVSTKPSSNHQLNHQSSKAVDNSREPAGLGDVLDNMLGARKK